MMTPSQSDTLPLQEEADLLLVRQFVRQRALELGFGVFDLTKIVTAASELGRNTLIHGGGGTLLLETLSEPSRRGLRLTFADNGPGIADIEQALTNGFSTKGGLGLGLGGTKRLINHFEIDSILGEGLRVTLMHWT